MRLSDLRDAKVRTLDGNMNGRIHKVHSDRGRVIALICGVLMLVSGRWSKFPLAAIAIICLALNQTGFIKQ